MSPLTLTVNADVETVYANAVTNDVETVYANVEERPFQGRVAKERRWALPQWPLNGEDIQVRQAGAR